MKLSKMNTDAQRTSQAWVRKPSTREDYEIKFQANKEYSTPTKKRHCCGSNSFSLYDFRKCLVSSMSPWRWIFIKGNNNGRVCCYLGTYLGHRKAYLETLVSLNDMQRFAGFRNEGHRDILCRDLSSPTVKRRR